MEWVLESCDSGKSGYILAEVSDKTFGDQQTHNYPAQNNKLSEYDVTAKVKKSDYTMGIMKFNSKCVGGVKSFIHWFPLLPWSYSHHAISSIQNFYNFLMIYWCKTYAIAF